MWNSARVTCWIVHTVRNVESLWSWRLTKNSAILASNWEVDEDTEVRIPIWDPFWWTHGQRQSREGRRRCGCCCVFQTTRKSALWDGRTPATPRSVSKRGHFFFLLVLCLSERGSCSEVHRYLTARSKSSMTTQDTPWSSKKSSRSRYNQQHQGRANELPHPDT